ncbi:hypothetical protein QNH23_08325 [Siminovitchia fortis]|uniref:Uncharacterized protein n=1 Tax=Siminovitchia fortis TaxID=254758 RepID=A0A443J0Z8_9BACI|nr:hypothetical protein [Siminovitchia fortis]RWR14070.1 hypothetical protein D4N35_002555 [Siminovitchia fortis]WHY83359.1 hypothetical protein QNH23_08325 [Siminovitchia fortis]
MSIRKEDVYKLVDQMDEDETEQAYEMLKLLLSKKGKGLYELAEADNTPLDEEELKELTDVIKEESVDWEEVKRELGL